MPPLHCRECLEAEGRGHHGTIPPTSMLLTKLVIPVEMLVATVLKVPEPFQKS